MADSFNPMLDSSSDEPEEEKKIDKDYVVTAKSDDGKYFYVLSDSMQGTLKQYEGGKKINTKNPVIDKYEKFSVDGKEYYGVDAKKQGAIGSDQKQYFDVFKWEFYPDTKKAKYYGGKTDLARMFDNMDVPSDYEGYAKETQYLDKKFDFDTIPD